MRSRASVLLGGLGLSVLSCAAVAGCTSASRSTASSLSVVSGSSVATPNSVANSNSAPVSALPCGDDRKSGQVVAVYRAMLNGTEHPDAASAPHLYVSTTLTNGGGLGTSAGVMSNALKQCLSTGVAGLPPISFVYGRDDPSIPTDSSGPGPISSFVGNVAFVSFGDVVVVGSKATSSISVDKGGGDVGGAEYVLKIADSGATVVSVGVRWIA